MLEQRVEELLAGIGRRGGGAVVAAVSAAGARVVASRRPRGVSEVGADTVFEIGSITKAFTGVLLADMHLAGRARLDDPLGRFLPWVGPGLEDVTLEQLATHRAGLPNTPREMMPGELAAATGLRRDNPWRGVGEEEYRQLVRRSGSRRRGGVRYSSLGFGLLGDALAACAGSTYAELLTERVLAPLGLHATRASGSSSLPGRSRRGRPRPEIDDPLVAAGALRSTAGDLLTWLGACLHPPEERPGPALRLAQEPRVPLGDGASLGLGWVVEHPQRQPPLVWHNGGTFGYRSFAGFVPGRDVAALALTNSDRSLDDLGRALVAAGLGERPGRPDA